ncbi:MAG TPA: hypothetical protein VG649_15290 [Candidatus Angelobacter sp.]|jgi:hypothetical protein|nr:hypothetical protein [Candidatus Angelobacter sp.]
MADINPNTLRDTLFIWVFATANSNILEGVIGSTISKDDLYNKLKGNIRDIPENVQTCNQLYDDIRSFNNIDTFRAIQKVLTSLPTLAHSWTGSPIHPNEVELQKVLILP